MSPCHLLHGLHDQLIMVYCNIRSLIYGGKLMLGRRSLIVLCLGRHSQLPKLNVQILHIGPHPLPNGAEIMILQLLTLGGRGSEQGASGKDQVLPLQIALPIHQKILLLRPHAGHHLGGLLIAEETHDPQRLLAQCLHGTKKRCLLIQSLPCIRAERRRNAENHPRGVLLQKRRGGDVPGRVPSCLEGSPQPS